MYNIVRKTKTKQFYSWLLLSVSDWRHYDKTNDIHNNNSNSKII